MYLNNRRIVGTSITELMVGFIVIAIIISFVIPIFSNYFEKSKLTQIQVDANALKKEIEIKYHIAGNLADTADALGKTITDFPVNREHIKAAIFDNGVLELIVDPTKLGLGTGEDITLEYIIKENESGGNNSLSWQCETKAEHVKYFSNCQTASIRLPAYLDRDLTQSEYSRGLGMLGQHLNDVGTNRGSTPNYLGYTIRNAYSTCILAPSACHHASLAQQIEGFQFMMKLAYSNPELKEAMSLEVELAEALIRCQRENDCTPAESVPSSFSSAQITQLHQPSQELKDAIGSAIFKDGLRGNSGASYSDYTNEFIGFLTDEGCNFIQNSTTIARDLDYTLTKRTDWTNAIARGQALCN